MPAPETSSLALERKAAYSSSADIVVRLLGGEVVVVVVVFVLFVETKFLLLFVSELFICASWCCVLGCVFSKFTAMPCSSRSALGSLLASFAPVKPLNGLLVNCSARSCLDDVLVRNAQDVDRVEVE